MPWICRKGANGGFSGTDDFSDIDDDLTIEEYRILNRILQMHGAIFVEKGGCRVRVGSLASKQASSLEADLRQYGFDWVNGYPKPKQLRGITCTTIRSEKPNGPNS